MTRSASERRGATFSRRGGWLGRERGQSLPCLPTNDEISVRHRGESWVRLTSNDVPFFESVAAGGICPLAASRRCRLAAISSHRVLAAGNTTALPNTALDRHIGVTRPNPARSALWGGHRTRPRRDTGRKPSGWPRRVERPTSGRLVRLRLFGIAVVVRDRCRHRHCDRRACMTTPRCPPVSGGPS